MARKHGLLLLVGLIVGLLLSGRYALKAQDKKPAASPPLTVAVPLNGPLEAKTEASPAVAGPDVQAHAPHTKSESPAISTLQDALLRPYRFPFARPTSLEQVCVHLRETLKGAIVLDLAALDRKSVGADDTVQLDLDGVRLKTGLKLLLDQVGLTYRVVAEDNLLIITDHEGADDPSEKIWAELQALHRDIHAVQDAVDELGDVLGVEEGAGPRVRKPTIVEDMPAEAIEKPGDPRQARPRRRPARRHGAARAGAAHLAATRSTGWPAPRCIVVWSCFIPERPSPVKRCSHSRSSVPGFRAIDAADEYGKIALGSDIAGHRRGGGRSAGPPAKPPRSG